jgi:uncharacterized protein
MKYAVNGIGSDRAVRPSVRVALLLSFLFMACGVSFFVTGSVIPTTPHDALIFQNALLFIVLGSAIVEQKFTKPADSMVNGLMGLITLIPVYRTAPHPVWWILFSYCAFVFFLSVACVASSSSPDQTGWQRQVANVTYRPAVVLGKARLLYSILFLFGVLSFYEIQSKQTAILILFWGLFIAIWPLGIPELLSAFSRSDSINAIGHILRTDSPNIVRVALNADSRWTIDAPKLYQRADGRQSLILPLYIQTQEEQSLGTGVCIPSLLPEVPRLHAGRVYELPKETVPTDEQLAARLSGEKGSKLLGFVVEGSHILSMKFETWKPELCREGLMVYTIVGDSKVYYQIIEGETREETLESDRHGYQVVTAMQLGTFDPRHGFQKFAWLPWMNALVFLEAPTFGAELEVPAGDFHYGNMPGSNVKVGGPFFESLDHHTAILGVTGSGKTELAFDLIRHSVARGAKVICIDLTRRYRGRLNDLTPKELSISQALSKELGDKLFAVETGQFGAGNEKKALKQFADRLRAEIKERLEKFLKSTETDDRVGIISLEEISNTQATLNITEIYLTCLLHFARDNQHQFPKTLVVVEEAHTVMPEPAAMGLGDYNSRGLVGKIAQIALQGRKYRVGLLVIAQRTANVSKTILTQCNTIISFISFDETSLGFLSNMYGATYTSFIPNLARLHAVIFGKGVRSERPVIVSIPFDQAKAAAEDEPHASADGSSANSQAETAVGEVAKA